MVFSRVASLGFLFLVSFLGCRFPLVVSLKGGASDFIVSIDTRLPTPEWPSDKPSMTGTTTTVAGGEILDLLVGGEGVGDVVLEALLVRL